MNNSIVRSIYFQTVETIMFLRIVLISYDGENAKMYNLNAIYTSRKVRRDSKISNK